MLADLVNRCIPLPSESKLLILGGGFTGQHMASVAKAHSTKVLCSRRTKESLGADCVFDSACKVIPKESILQDVTHLLSCIPPSSKGTDPVLECLQGQLQKMPLQWVGYLSTTGVYGDCQGEWVAESDRPNPQQPRSQRRLACEKSWQATGLPVQILRLPGIYGPGRSVLKSIKTGTTKIIDKPGQVFSRVHVDDIIGATYHLINLTTKGCRPEIINIADDLPTSSLEVMRFAANLIGHATPPIEPFNIAASKMSEMALSFWQENRRVSNKKLCQELGYSLIHPTYQSGLKDCVNQDA